ncbi:hypothetical protein ACLB2K_046070 [Fragaria x ananassa]
MLEESYANSNAKRPYPEGIIVHFQLYLARHCRVPRELEIRIPRGHRISRGIGIFWTKSRAARPRHPSWAKKKGHSLTINGSEFMIHLAFLAGVGVRVANELGAGNGQAAKFAAKVAVAESSFISLFFCVLIVALLDKFAYIFTSSTDVLLAVDNLSYLLAVTILLNGVQPVLSGVAVGSGWQAWVAYVNLFCYYIVGHPLGIVLGFVADYGYVVWDDPWWH